MAICEDYEVINLLRVEPLEIIAILDHEPCQKAQSLMLPETLKLYLRDTLRTEE